MPKVLPRSDQSYLVELVYLSNIEGLSLEDSVKRLGISRSKAQEILRKAREEGMIETTILVDRLPQDDLGDRVRKACQSFGIQEVIVMPGPAYDLNLYDREYRAYLRRHLGLLAASYVEKLPLEPKSHICIGSGRTMMAFAQRYNPAMKDLILRPLAVGGRWGSIAHTDAAAVLQTLLYRLGFRGQGKPKDRLRVICPDVSAGMAARAKSQPEIRAVFGHEAQQPAVVISAIGRRRYVPVPENGEGPPQGPHPATSSPVKLFAESRYYLRNKARLADDPSLVYVPLDDSVYREANEIMWKQEIVTDVCRHAIDLEGREHKGYAEETALTLDLKTLRRWNGAGTKSILVVGGSMYFHALKAVLQARLFDTLIIDTALAVQLLEPEARPEPYREVPAVPDPAKEEEEAWNPFEASTASIQ